MSVRIMNSVFHCVVASAILCGAILTMGCGGKKVTKIETASQPAPRIEVKETAEPEVEAPSEAVAPEPLVLGNVHFGFDRYDLTPAAREILATHAQAIRQRENVTVVIEGHCDERGTIEYNLALGQKRAKAVRDYLVSLGVEASRLSTVSYGKERPVDPRNNEEAWAKNRRAQFVVKTLS